MSRIEFERESFEKRLRDSTGKTLGEIDTEDVFRRTKTAKKITRVVGTWSSSYY